MLVSSRGSCRWPNSNYGMIHNDHLGTPQKLIDSTGTVVWSADYKPFGEATITVSTITNNLRFPGQYFDAETGLLYNYFRDFNPATGRYIEADRMGLRGGINLYRYARGNPLFWIDPWGLVECVKDGKVTRVGWENPNDHKQGFGWRVYVTTADGNDIYAHMDPQTTPEKDTWVHTGDNMGDYANPTNGKSDAPHLHFERKDATGRSIDPGNAAPIPNGRVTSPYGDRGPSHSGPRYPNGHPGVDIVNP